ncbi:integrase catalytic domain-containing protein [Trichonephila inaurata madagascariensis]|uniref:Integrase catalytic domain-containing protein n=1 Tax=Trichonephila inaurata madagascariensis TaxID=2747483 RepID=A0A8X7C045_9ARAC|nr:integrase catalytic domain-containing protein [Trichonephila inaurata madagascariensis]
MEDRLEELEERVRDILNSLIAKSSVSSVHNHENAISQANSKLKLEIKLPEIPLAVFRGRYDEWPSFKSQFDNVITNNNYLNESQKLYYLKASLQGDANLLEAVDDSFESLITALKLDLKISAPYWTQNQCCIRNRKVNKRISSRY